MKKVKYPYSRELTEPAGSVNCNRNNPWIAWKERQSIRRAKKEVEQYVPPCGIKMEKITYRSWDSSEIACYILGREEADKGKSPCMIYYHGGGFMMPLQGMMLRNAAYYAEHTGCRVFLPEYRYAPEADCRTIIEDCFFLVKHLREYGAELGIDPDRLILYGDSAGAALAAGVAHLMRDRALPKAAGQMLIYPVTDCYSDRYASMKKYPYAVWPRKSNDYMWKLYLKGADEDTKRLAAPLNMEDFTGLPLAYVEPQEIDILCDEGIAYAEKLKEHGSLAECSVVKGSYHGFDFDHGSPLVQRMLAHRCKIIRRFLTEKEMEG